MGLTDKWEKEGVHAEPSVGFGMSNICTPTRWDKIFYRLLLYTHYSPDAWLLIHDYQIYAKILEIVAGEEKVKLWNNTV